MMKKESRLALTGESAHMQIRFNNQNPKMTSLRGFGRWKLKLDTKIAKLPQIAKGLTLNVNVKQIQNLKGSQMIISAVI